MDKLKSIKNTKLFKNLTKKEADYCEFLKSRIANHINKDIAQEMLGFALSKEESLNVYHHIETDYFKNKTSVKNPVIHLVISQAGGGKSKVSKSILQNYPNTVFIDSDVFKKYNPLKDLLLEHCPTYFGYLTGLDSYLHRDFVYEKAINCGYNILIEITPSTKEGLFNINLDVLRKKGYKIISHFLCVSKINSLISVHERYEKQIQENYIIPKLTDLPRAIDSCDAIQPMLEQLNNLDYVKINLYKRTADNKNVALVKSTENNCIASFLDLQAEDFNNTLKNKDKRIKNLTKQMQLRDAPIKQFDQLKEVIKLIDKENNS